MCQASLGLGFGGEQDRSGPCQGWTQSSYRPTVHLPGPVTGSGNQNSAVPLDSPFPHQDQQSQGKTANIPGSSPGPVPFKSSHHPSEFIPHSYHSYVTETQKVLV